jgi:hypothetical protein
MSLPEILILLAMTAYAVHRQSVRHAVVGRTRFKLALIYAGVGLAVGGVHLPPDGRAWLALGIGLTASVLVGVARGWLTQIELSPDGQVFSRGTPVTIGLFLLLVGSKYAWGTWEYLHHAHPHGGFGEVLLQIAAMAALQAQIVWKRAQTLRAARPTEPPGIDVYRRSGAI